MPPPIHGTINAAEKVMPGYSGFAITPHDTNLLPSPIRGLYVGVSGDVTLVDPEGTTLLFKNAVQGTELRFRAKAVKATGTTATNLIGIY